MTDPVQAGPARPVGEPQLAGSGRGLVAEEPRPLAVGEEEVGPVVAVEIGRAHPADAVLHHAEFQFDFFGVQFRIAMVLVVNADVRRLQFGEPARAARNANALDQLIFDDLPVVALTALIDQAPEVEVAVLKQSALFVHAVQNELDDQLNAAPKLDLPNHVDLELDVVYRGQAAYVLANLVLQIGFAIVLMALDSQPRNRHVAFAAVRLERPATATWRGVAVGVKAQDR